MTGTRRTHPMTGYFSIGVYHPKTEANVGTLWRHASLYGASMISTVGRRYRHQAGDTTKAPRNIPLVHFDTVDDLIRHLPYDCPLIGVELDPRAEMLDDTFRHPDRGFYLLGAEDHGLPQSVIDRCHRLIQIPTPKSWSMNVAVAGTIIMHDRFMKKNVRVGV